jgi:hypothetical protein
MCTVENVFRGCSEMVDVSKRELPKEIEPLFDLEMRLWGATLTRLGIFVWGNIVMKIGFVTIVYV